MDHPSTPYSRPIAANKNHHDFNAVFQLVLQNASTACAFPQPGNNLHLAPISASLKQPHGSFSTLLRPVLTPKTTTLKINAALYAPASCDVLIGTQDGKNHIGNRLFWRLVEMNRHCFHEMNPLIQAKLVESIVKAIYSRGGRFLRFDAKSKLYSEMDYQEVFKKTRLSILFAENRYRVVDKARAIKQVLKQSVAPIDDTPPVVFPPPYLAATPSKEALNNHSTTPITSLKKVNASNVTASPACYLSLRPRLSGTHPSTPYPAPLEMDDHDSAPTGVAAPTLLERAESSGSAVVV